MKMKSVLFFLMSLCVLVGGAEYRIIADFEKPEDLKGWRTKNLPEMTFSRSTAWADSGEASVEMSFKPAKEVWQINQLPLKSINANDWSGYDTYELTIYNPGKTTWSQGIMIRPYVGHGILRVERIAPGVNRYIFELDKIRNSTNLENIGEIWLGWHAPSEEILLYVDNIRLGDYTGERRRALTGRLTAALSAFPSETEFTTLLQQAPQADRTGLKDIHARAGALAVRILDDTSSPLPAERRKALAMLLAPLPMQDIESSDGSTAARQTALDNIAEGERRLAEHIRREELKRALRQNLSRHYPEASFAVGRCSYPRAWSKEDIFDGRMDGEISIAGAAREIVPCQLLIVGRRDCDNIHVSAELNGLPGAGIEIAPMGWIKNPRTGKLVADMLRPDIKEFKVTADDMQPVWINIEIPADAVSGNYSGTIRISGGGRTDSIPLNLRVYPFELPAVPTLHTGTHGAVQNPAADYDFLRKHRFNPGNIYAQDAPSLDEMRNSGVTFFNLMRFSDQGKGGFAQKDGRTIYSPARWNLYNGKLSRWIEKNAGTESDWEYILKNCFIYTYDEPTPEAAASLSELCGKIKRQYRGIRTAAALNMDIDPRIENLDIIMGTPQYLRKYRHHFPELKQSGKEIWWYNLFNDPTNPAGCRGQFWATWLDGFDGVLHYLVRDRTDTLFGPDLYYPQQAGKSLLPGENGTIRRNAEKLPLSTVAFEYWREGIQDHEYLTLLRRKTEELASSGNAAKHSELLDEARQLLKLEGIAAGIMDDSPRQENEITLAFGRLSSDMSDFIRTKARAAELIIKIQEALPD